MSRHEFNSIGQSIQKNLHQDYDASGFWQSVDYAYNIRGWTTQINPLQTSAGQTDDFFAMRLSYGNGEYNGNIKSISWQIDPGNSPLQQKYSFSYDGLSRLLTADYEEQYQFPGSSHNPGQFDVDLSYDLNGNIETLERNARGSATNSPTNPWETTFTSFTLDNLTYDYTGGGNQLQKVSDAATTNQTAAYAQFLDGSNSGDDYDYDANGNLTQDLNKGISSISYNHLDKPTVITYSNGNIIRYYYSADGMKLRQTVYSADQSDPPVFAIRKRSDYLGAIQYEDADGDGTTEELEILFAQHEEGRYRPNGGEMIYEYNLTDHLGNTRITFGDSDADGDADILQEDHYYPFGMLMTMTSSPSAAPPNDYLYNGKELQTELGLDWYDYGARMYDASIGRFHVQDRFSGKFKSVSPYNYTANNPIKFIDVNGDSIWVRTVISSLDNGDVRVTHVVHITAKVYSANGDYELASKVAKGLTNRIRSQQRTFVESPGVGGSKVITEFIFSPTHFEAVRSMESVDPADQLVVLVDDVLGKGDPEQCDGDCNAGGIATLGGHVAYVQTGGASIAQMIETAFHEVGHLLRLGHPDKDLGESEINNPMGYHPTGDGASFNLEQLREIVNSAFPFNVGPNYKRFDAGSATPGTLVPGGKSTNEQPYKYFPRPGEKIPLPIHNPNN